MSPFFLDPDLLRQLHADRLRRLDQATHARHARLRPVGPAKTRRRRHPEA